MIFINQKYFNDMLNLKCLTMKIFFLKRSGGGILEIAIDDAVILNVEVLYK